MVRKITNPLVATIFCITFNLNSIPGKCTVMYVDSQTDVKTKDLDVTSQECNMDDISTKPEFADKEVSLVNFNKEQNEGE